MHAAAPFADSPEYHARSASAKAAIKGYASGKRRRSLMQNWGHADSHWTHLLEAISSEPVTLSSLQAIDKYAHLAGSFYRKVREQCAQDSAEMQFFTDEIAIVTRTHEKALRDTAGKLMSQALPSTEDEKALAALLLRFILIFPNFDTELFQNFLAWYCTQPALFLESLNAFSDHKEEIKTPAFFAIISNVLGTFLTDSTSTSELKREVCVTISKFICHFPSHQNGLQSIIPILAGLVCMPEALPIQDSFFWCLSNLISGNAANQSILFAQPGLIEVLLRDLKSDAPTFKHDILRLLGNLIFNHPDHQARLTGPGTEFVEALLHLLEVDPKLPQETRMLSTWALINLSAHLTYADRITAAGGVELLTQYRDVLDNRKDIAEIAFASSILAHLSPPTAPAAVQPPVAASACPPKQKKSERKRRVVSALEPLATETMAAAAGPTVETAPTGNIAAKKRPATEEGALSFPPCSLADLTSVATRPVTLAADTGALLAAAPAPSGVFPSPSSFFWPRVPVYPAPNPYYGANPTPHSGFYTPQMQPPELSPPPVLYLPPSPYPLHHAPHAATHFGPPLPWYQAFAQPTAPLSSPTGSLLPMWMGPPTDSAQAQPDPWTEPRGFI